MKNLVLSILLIAPLFTIGQVSLNLKNYQVTHSDLISDTYEKDSLANALVIYEQGKSHIEDENFELIFEFKQKLKIFNRDGFNKADIIISLYNDKKRKEIIDDIVATTYNIEDGTITSTKLEKSQIFKEKYNEHITLVKFSLPNIKEGSVITYGYKLKSPFIYKYKPWRFQSDIPKLYSEYQASIPGNYEYNIKLVGSLKLDTNENKLKKHCVDGGNGSSADCIETTYAMKNIPAFIEEGFMTTKDNYLSRVDYELRIVKSFDGTVNNITKTWETTDKELKYDSGIGRQMKKNGIVKGLLSDEIISENDILKKSKSIYQFVQSNFIWNEKYNIFGDVSVKNLIKTKLGNVSEINLLLYNLLRNEGIDVTPVILSTRNNGLPTKIYPVISDFNYIIIRTTINGKNYHLDATDKFLDFGQIPFRCLNQYGRLLDFKNGSTWVDIQAKETSTKQYKVELNINDDSTISGQVIYITKGYHALPIKKNYFNNPSEYLSFHQKKYVDIEISNYKTDVTQKNDFLFKENFDINLTTETIGNNLYINPFLFSFFKTNPFKLQERTYPIDFGYKDAYLYSLKIKVDEKFEIIEIPKEVTYQLPNKKGQITLKCLKKNNVINIYFKFDFKEAIYNSSYYTSLKKYMNTIIDIESNSLIVLKEK
ncbi:MAG: hypothetical protein COA88_03615 [Kordia sp.]|nr:MAG: hypothetical protein COA88_03615 [Kordia sp.]